LPKEAKDIVDGSVLTTIRRCLGRGWCAMRTGIQKTVTMATWDVGVQVGHRHGIPLLKACWMRG
jgi:hypothetical protein